MQEFTIKNINEEQILQLTKLLSSKLQNGVVYLEGNLGAGKTTFVRYLLQNAGFKGRVKSPTYSIYESYVLESLNIYHFDLYRLNDPEELEYIGVRELENDNSLLLFEWSEKGKGFIKEADCIIAFDYINDENARALQIQVNDKFISWLEIVKNFET